MAIVWRQIDKTLLKPAFLADIEALLQNSPYTWYVLEGFRSIDRSKQLYDAYQAYLQGKGPFAPRAAPPGKSAHNWGLAVDVVLDTSDDPGLQPSWDTKLKGWLWLKTASIKHPRLKNGWSFSDWPHIERYHWEIYK